MAEFARKQLEKYGWCEGKGLGKEENGIVNPIKSKLKFDKQGIGHDNVKQWTSAWWYDMFNDASKRISIKKSETGVCLSGKKRLVESTSPSPVLVHKRFVKAETMEHLKEKPSIIKDTINDSKSVISDSFFKNCEGTKKTCFNYSLMKGKIKRIKKQEAIYENKCKGKITSKKKKNHHKKLS